MSASIVLGQAKGHPVKVSLKALIQSRLLIQGTSGSGKSHAARRLVEQAEPSVQCVVIDPEGEYATLREKHPFLLFGPGGEKGAETRSAGLIARTILELGRSAVIDLSEAKGRDHVAFVKAFAEGLMSAPRALAHELLLVIEEAHLFAPEGSKADSTDAVIDLAKRGRKRGYCVIAATQRISDLSKSVAGILGSRLIGLTTLDNDIRRAAYDLGMEPAAARDQLKALELGDFFAYGPAFSFKGVEQIHVAETDTKAPDWSARAKPPPPTPEKLRSCLARLDEIPRQAEEELRTLAEVKADNARLRREAAERDRAAAKGESKPEDKARVREQAATIATLRKAVETAMRFIIQVTAKGFDVVGVDTSGLTQALQDAVARAVQGLDAKLETRAREVERLKLKAGEVVKALEKLAAGEDVQVAVEVTRNEPFTVTRSVARGMAPRAPAEPPTDGISRPQQAILDGLRRLEGIGVNGTTWSMTALLGRQSPKSSGFEKNVSVLRTAGYLEGGRGEGFRLTGAGRDTAHEAPVPLTTAEIVDEACQLISTPQAAMLRTLVEAGPDVALEWDVLAGETDQSPKSSGYEKNISVLRSLGLIDGGRDKGLSAARILFPGAAA